MNKLFANDTAAATRTLRVCQAAIALAALAAPLAGQEITAVRFWSLGDVTRIAIEATGPFDFSSDRLDNPARIFFDLPGTSPALGHKGINVIGVDDQFVRQIRVAQTQQRVTRVVLDIEGAVEVSTSRLENPDRLIVELRRPGSHPIPPSGIAAEATIAGSRKFQPPAPPQTTERHAAPPVLDAPPPLGTRATSTGPLKNDIVAKIPGGAGAAFRLRSDTPRHACFDGGRRGRAGRAGGIHQRLAPRPRHASRYVPAFLEPHRLARPPFRGARRIHDPRAGT